MILSVSVIPNSKKFAISVKNGRIKILLESPPENNRANSELITKLSKLTGKKVNLLRGHKSKNKTIAIDISPDEWSTFLKTFD